MRSPLLLISALFAAGCVSSPAERQHIHVSKAIVSHVRNVAPGTETAAYAKFDNRGPADRLVAVRCDCADRVEIHHLVGEGDDRTMVHEPFFLIPANAVSAIEPPGLEWHLMLRDVKRPIAVGDQIAMTLVFERGGARTVRFRAVDGTRAAWEAMGD